VHGNGEDRMMRGRPTEVSLIGYQQLLAEERNARGKIIGNVQAIVLGRGGGNASDLAPFWTKNEYGVGQSQRDIDLSRTPDSKTVGCLPSTPFPKDVTSSWLAVTANLQSVEKSVRIQDLAGIVEFVGGLRKQQCAAMVEEADAVGAEQRMQIWSGVPRLSRTAARRDTPDEALGKVRDVEGAVRGKDEIVRDGRLIGGGIGATSARGPVKARGSPGKFSVDGLFPGSRVQRKYPRGRPIEDIYDTVVIYCQPENPLASRVLTLNGVVRSDLTAAIVGVEARGDVGKT
jgi:hypothetical protein